MNFFKSKTKDFIFHKKKALSKDKCDLIMKLFENDGENWKENDMLSKIDGTTKTCTEIFVERNQKNLYNDLFLNELVIALEEYKEQYPYLNEIHYWSLFDVYKIQRYYPGEGYCILHCENQSHIPHPNHDPLVSTRILAWMIYLNDVTEGGHTEFPTQNKLLQPRSGDIVIWPAYWTHPHRGIVSKTQTKYIMTGWYNFSTQLRC